MKLTKNFTLEELTATHVAAVNSAIKREQTSSLDLPSGSRVDKVNSPNPVQTANLCQLCERVLQPLRDAWGGPITVNSGFRSKAVNKAVGGVKNSQHLQGQAADITVGNPTRNHELFQMAIELNLPFDQLIDEKDYRWIHVSYSPRNRRQILHLK